MKNLVLGIFLIFSSVVMAGEGHKVSEFSHCVKYRTESEPNFRSQFLCFKQNSPEADFRDSQYTATVHSCWDCNPKTLRLSPAITSILGLNLMMDFQGDSSVQSIEYGFTSDQSDPNHMLTIHIFGKLQNNGSYVGKLRFFGRTFNYQSL